MGQKTVPTRRVAQHCFAYIICAQFLDCLEDCSNGQKAFVGVDHVLDYKVSPSEEFSCTDMSCGAVDFTWRSVTAA